MHTNVGACRTHEGGLGTNKSALELTWRDRNTAPHADPPRDRNQDLNIALNSDSVTTDLIYIFDALRPVQSIELCEGWKT